MSTSALGRQFTSKTVGKQTAKVIKKFPPKTVADAVYDQLTEDYPKSALDWVHKIQWKGPVNVPLKDIDFSEKNTWAASREVDEVHAWEKRIAQAKAKGEHIKPAVLIQRPKATAMVPDGHHRALAYENMKEPVYSWLGVVNRAKGPWDNLHDKQYRDSTGPQKGGNPGLYHYGRKNVS